MNHVTLLGKYLNGTITAEETDALFAYIKTRNEADAGFEEVLQSTFQQSLTEEPALSRNEHSEMLTKLLQQIQQQDIATIPVHRVHFLRKWGWAAASALLLLAVGSYFWFSPTAKPTEQTAVVLNTAPGKKGAVLTLANGSQMVLDSVGNGVIAHQQGSQIMLQNNQLSYQNQSQPDLQQNQTEIFNTISTPRGKQYQVVLPDGTKVWLNAASSLRFPVQFNQANRTVTLSGEAYFEVSSNASAPFKVISGKQEVTVLGTHFNISAYNDEAIVKTTLLEGRIKVASVQQPALSQILQPGQQSILRSDKINVSGNADVQEVLAWKNGQLSMKNLDVKALMRQISRWYDVDVVYEGILPEGHFGGIIDHDVYLYNIIEVLEAGGINCRVEGKKLYVSAK